MNGTETGKAEMDGTPDSAKREDRIGTPGPEDGFTLIELILAVVVLGVLAAVISLNLSAMSTVALDQAVNKVVGDIRYVQQLSITTQTRHGITIDSLQQYTGHRDNTPAPDAAVPNPVNLGQNFVVDFDVYQQGQLEQVRFSSTTPFCGGSVIEFDSSGVPTDTNGTVLVCASVVTLAYGGNTRTITISPNTGRLLY